MPTNCLAPPGSSSEAKRELLLRVAHKPPIKATQPKVKRIDFILSGRDNSNKDSVIIIELKQWETCTAVEGKDGIVSTYTGGGIREVTHPSYQAMSYANLIKDFNETVQLEDIGLYPCAFLHNYDLSINDPINSEQYQEYIKEYSQPGNIG